jgi:uncharacterized DUF497 family protein
MEFVWDEAKDEWLRVHRGVSFEEIAAELRDQKEPIIEENPTRPEQMLFVVQIRNYTWVVPFVIDEQERLVLKTTFPSRKYHRKYGGTSHG